jgi:hypothetical protein
MILIPLDAIRVDDILLYCMMARARGQRAFIWRTLVLGSTGGSSELQSVVSWRSTVRNEVEIGMAGNLCVLHVGLKRNPVTLADFVIAVPECGAIRRREPRTVIERIFEYT